MDRPSKKSIQNNRNIHIYTIIKKLQLSDTEYHAYKPKQDRSFRRILKNIYLLTKIDDIKRLRLRNWAIQ